jgi:hypothetical protein
MNAESLLGDSFVKINESENQNIKLFQKLINNDNPVTSIGPGDSE